MEVRPDEALFISGDNLWLHAESLFDIAELFYLNGGRFLLIDDLHKIQDRVQSITQIMNELPDLRLISTSAAPLSFSDSIAIALVS